MIYTFAKSKDGNVVRLGGIDMDALQGRIDEFEAAGYVVAEAAEWDKQVFDGARAGVEQALPVNEGAQDPTPTEKTAE